MSALVDEAIKQCRAEELKLTETIRQFRELLRSMKTCVKHGTEAEPTTSVKDHDIPLKERQEVELLEQVLEKALKIRSSSAVGSKYQEKSCSKASASKASAVKGGDKRNPQKLSSEVKEIRQGPGQLKNTNGHGGGATRRVPSNAGPSSRPTVKVKQPGKRTSHLDQERKIQCEASAPEEQWVPSPLLSLWHAQRTKKNKLWTKVLTRYSMPVPERDHFKKRLISTFPTEWAPVHMATMEAQLGVLTQLGLDLTHCYNAELQRHQLGFSPEPSTEKDYESLLMLAGLEKIMVQVINEAGHLKKDWEKRMARWRGSLCLLRSRIDWHDSEQPLLPPAVAYSSNGELEELYRLRLHVAQLKLEIHIHQAALVSLGFTPHDLYTVVSGSKTLAADLFSAVGRGCMCDVLSDLISCESSSSGRPSAILLRGVYSLLGEGGTQFPSLVLDFDSTQT